MQKKVKEKILIQYLLGQLSEEKMNQIEAKYFTDDSFFEQLQAVENDLVDNYVLNQLSTDQRQQFEKHYLATPTGRENVEFAKLFREVVNERAVLTKTESSSVWSFLTEKLNAVFKTIFSSRNLQIGFAVTVVLLIIGSTWSLLKIEALQEELTQFKSNGTTASEKVQALEQKLAEQQQGREQLAQQLEQERTQRTRLEQEMTEGPQPASVVAAFALTPGTLRQATEKKPLIIPEQVYLLRFELEVWSEERYDIYRAALQPVDGEEIWRQSNLRLQITEKGDFIQLLLPQSLFTDGQYLVVLQGKTQGGKFEQVGIYHLNVVRRK